MFDRAYKRFYIISLSVLLALSAYPVINGVRIACLSIANGAVKPEQYARYVVPYTAICLAVLLFTASQPIFLKLRRFALPVGMMVSYLIFFLAELFFEGIKIHTTGMTLVDTSSLSIGELMENPYATIDLWQASLCVVSPPTRSQSVAFASRDHYYYVLANNSYKTHYYFVSIILITMVCILVYGIGRKIRLGCKTEAQPLALQGISTMLLISLCIFANTTAFFRKAQPIQTPVASVLTCLFFIALGTTIGVYTGSFLTGKNKWLGTGLPVSLSMTAVILMYAGEAAMMDGNLYRFGTGWFFAGLPVILLAPVDILVILLAGLASYLILQKARKKENWPGKKLIAISLIICAIIAVSGVCFSVKTSNLKEEIYGRFEFDSCIYMTLVSSYLPVKGSVPYVYSFDENSLIITDTKTGKIVEILSAHYEKTPVAEDEFSKLSMFGSLSFQQFGMPDLKNYKERWLRAVFTSEKQQRYGLYQMDDEVWLAELKNNNLWSIYRLEKVGR